MPRSQMTPIQVSLFHACFPCRHARVPFQTTAPNPVLESAKLNYVCNKLSELSELSEIAMTDSHYLGRCLLNSPRVHIGTWPRPCIEILDPAPPSMTRPDLVQVIVEQRIPGGGADNYPGAG
jgi:hypothetical protein